MTTRDIFKIINTELNVRHLKNPNIRKNALSKIISFIEDTKIFLLDDQLNLPNQKRIFEVAYTNYKNKNINGAERHVKKLIYDYVYPNQTYKFPVANLTQQSSKALTSSLILEMDISKIEKELIQVDYYSVNELSKIIPAKPGIYCVKLRKDVVLPRKYGNIRKDGIIYIGVTSKSLLKRLWEEELNHKRSATFFRSIGAILGYLPLKGSLAPYRYDYKFSENDTNAIRKWMKQSLLVSFLPSQNTSLNEIEKTLIKKYQPLINLKHNPKPNKELKNARNKCVQYGRGVDFVISMNSK